MSDNRKFYVKYLENRPVGVNTHIIIATTGQWVQTVFCVEDLIAAYKTANAPRFDSTPIDELSLHTSVDAEALRPEILLSCLTTGFTSDNPLILKSAHTMNSDSSTTATVIAAVEQVLHRTIRELRGPISVSMSQCSNSKFQLISGYYGLKFTDVPWEFNLPLDINGFEWNGRGENECILEIVSFLTNNVPTFQFKDARDIRVVVEYANNDTRVQSNGKLDIAALLPNAISTNPENILFACIAIIEIKTPRAITDNRLKSINQTRLQLIALNAGGNDHKPFALLTNMTDYWHFMWITQGANINSTIFNNPNQGIAALNQALDMMNNVQNSCPFINRTFVSFPEMRGGGGYTECNDVANMEDFYDEMTQEEVFRHKAKIGVSRFFQMMNPSLRANFILE